MSTISTDSIMQSLKQSFGILVNIKVIITTLIITWGIFMSTYIIRQSADDDESMNTSWKYYNFHRVWFGDESLLIILFNIWFKTLLIAMFIPIAKELFHIMNYGKMIFSS